MGFYIPEDAILHSHRRENLKSYRISVGLSVFLLILNQYTGWRFLGLHSGGYEEYRLLGRGTVNRCFEETCNLHLQGRKNPRERNGVGIAIFFLNVYSRQTYRASHPTRGHSSIYSVSTKTRLGCGDVIIILRYFDNEQWVCQKDGSLIHECSVFIELNHFTHLLPVSGITSLIVQLVDIWKILCFHGGDYEECHFLRYKNQVRTSQETHYVSATESNQWMLCKIWGFHGGDYEECRLLGYKTQFVLHRRHITAPLQSPAG
jgi:hypothetical protein